jgi:hypothetical protein
VHRDLAPHAVARDGVGVARFERQVQRGAHELGHVARAAHARGEHDLVARALAPDEVAVDAHVGDALPGARIPG